jgi:hypothetical protein
MKLVEIRVKGHLDVNWSDWFGGLRVQHLCDDESLISGSITDQSELYGLLSKLRNLGLELVSINIDDDLTMDQIDAGEGNVRGSGG